MKSLRKGIAFFMMLILCFSMSVTAFAENSYSITINNSADGYTYKAYQIFTGDLYEGVLSNVVWGSGVTQAGQEALGDAAQKADSMDGAGAAQADAFASSLVAGQYLDDSAAITLTYSNGKYIAEGLAAGYYLVVNTGVPASAEDTVYSDYIVQVVDNVTVNPKSVLPSVDKQVYDETAEAWQENTDARIGAPVEFKLTATLTADAAYGSYSTYQLVFEDTLSEGLTFDALSGVSVNGNAITAYEASTEVDGQWTLTIDNILAIADPTAANVVVEVLYTAHLNEKAQINLVSGKTTNANTAALKYSNNPNAAGLGITESDSVYVFTSGAEYVKVDGKNKPLDGAGFTLYQVSHPETGGTTLDPIALVKKNGIYYPAAAGENTEAYALSQMDGSMKFHGLNAGEYLLRETKTPDGYNTCADITIHIDMSHDETVLAEDQVTITAENTQMNIINQSGTQLPHTGGRGTRIFYLTGTIVMICALVLLILQEVRRRMKMDF